MFDPKDAIRPGDPLSCDLNGRSIRAKLHRSMLDFLAASAKSESNDDCGENDCALHVIFSLVSPGLSPLALASDVLSRDISAELQRRVLNFATASAKRHSRNHC